jgi:hypothetical protein
MAAPIQAKDAIVQFYKGAAFYEFYCTQDFSLDFSKETKSTKTIGDGNWNRQRADTNGLQISLSGLVQTQTVGNPDVFDVLDYFMQDIDIQFKIVFTDTSNSNVKVIDGYALPINVNLSAGVGGYAKGSMTLVCNGKPNVADSFTGCSLTMIAATVTAYTGEGAVTGAIQINYTAPAGTFRIDFTLDGGGRLSILTPAITPSSGVYPINENWTGSHTLVLIPICTNGEDSTILTTVNFTI